jgi:hypothetical protein
MKKGVPSSRPFYDGAEYRAGSGKESFFPTHDDAIAVGNREKKGIDNRPVVLERLASVHCLCILCCIMLSKALH